MVSLLVLLSVEEHVVVTCDDQTNIRQKSVATQIDKLENILQQTANTQKILHVRKQKVLVKGNHGSLL